MSTASQELLHSFDNLPASEKREVASTIMRRAFALEDDAVSDESQLALLYAEFAHDDGRLADEGIEDYSRALVGEDT